MREPLAAAAPLLPALPPADPQAPGPFAFADAGRVRSILADAGFRAVTVDAFDTRIGGADLEETLKVTIRVGPLGAALREHPHLKDQVVDAVRGVLVRHATGHRVLLPAAVWIVLAHNKN